MNRAIGLYTVTAPSSGFVVDVSATGAVYGAAHQRPLGHAPTRLITKPSVEREHATDAESVTSRSGTAAVYTDPLDDKLWGLRMVKADKARTVTAGSKKVLVGVLDTGVDASNPDIAPNFSFGLSRNFAPDITTVDGPCEVARCLDPVGTDDGGHGTHVGRHHRRGGERLRHLGRRARRHAWSSSRAGRTPATSSSARRQRAHLRR